MDFIKANPSEFAAAYIQTLPHAMKENEFDSREDFLEYLDHRQESYLHHFIKSAAYANDEFQKLTGDDSDDI